MTKTRMLIVGARGFIGAHVTRAFLSHGHNVHTFGPPMTDDLPSDIADDLVDIPGSILNRAEIGEAIRSARPDMVLSFAAFSTGRHGLTQSAECDGDGGLDVAVSGFRNLLEAALVAGVRRVLWSSSTVVFGPASEYGNGRVDESAACRPRTLYGLGKTMAEQLAQYYRDRHGLDVCGLRLPLVFGPGLWYRGAAAQLADLFGTAASGASFRISGTGQRFDVMYVKDVAEAFLALAKHRDTRMSVYHVSGFDVTYPDLVAAVTARVRGYRVDFEATEAAIVYPLISTERIARDIGFRPQFDMDKAVDDYLSEQRVN